jgi:hypothetical protein
MDHFWTSFVTVASAIIGLAIIAVLVSNNAATVKVIKAGSSGFSEILKAATGPLGDGGIGSALQFPGVPEWGS